MIHIRYDECDYNAIFSMKGHADYAPAGIEDIVCASASTLFYTLLEYLRRWEETGTICDTCFEIEAGESRIDWTYKNEYARCTVGVGVACVIDGLRLLAQKYPDNVRFDMGP